MIGFIDFILVDNEAASRLQLVSAEYISVYLTYDSTLKVSLGETRA